MNIQPLSQRHALEIANDWHYEGIYAFYNMEADPEDYAELISEEARGNRYYQVLRDGSLYGFFYLEEVAPESFELGLGLKPEHCGKGQGKAFLELILSYIKEHFSAKTVFLSVADFNQRAQALYLNSSFDIVDRYPQETNGDSYLFVKMKKEME
ncbi:GNAT family N-acetyltransferase [Streptococcus massiliensis]|uniref:Acetyltransferase n=1 Tax=Streptococcus massiliensis TaxID=313439 RepID=A0A380L2G9_9STRE|nr:GNAT family N-acetyltransferase [Streptococcus massiliensis]SUN77437.1 acetyltransferase [Streptococcus massiliensis]